MDKKEALERLTALEDEAEKLRTIIEAPEVDYEKWVGKLVVASDDKLLPLSTGISALHRYDSSSQSPFIVYWGRFPYARLATLEECGFVDWSKMPDWADAIAFTQDGQQCWTKVNNHDHVEATND